MKCPKCRSENTSTQYGIDGGWICLDCHAEFREKVKRRSKELFSTIESIISRIREFYPRLSDWDDREVFEFMFRSKQLVIRFEKDIVKLSKTKQSGESAKEISEISEWLDGGKKQT